MVIKKYLPQEQVERIIGHDPSVHFGLLVKHALILGGIIGIWHLVGWLAPMYQMKWAFALAGVAVLGWFVIEFLNRYLDGMVISDTGMAVFWREGLLEYKMEFFDWSRVETISYEQDSIRDRVLGKGDLILSLTQGTQYPFENVSQPKKIVQSMLQIKHKHYSHMHDQPIEEHNGEKVQMLAEALGDVIQDYMKK